MLVPVEHNAGPYHNCTFPNKTIGEDHGDPPAVVEVFGMLEAAVDATNTTKSHPNEKCIPRNM